MFFPGTPQPEFPGAAESDVGLEAELLVWEQVEIRGELSQQLEHDPQFHPGERGAEAEVDAVTEGDVPRGALSGHVEDVRVVEPGWVAVRGAQCQQQLGSGGDVDFADAHRAGGHPALGEHAGVEP